MQDTPIVECIRRAGCGYGELHLAPFKMVILVFDECGGNEMDFLLEEELMDLMMFCLQNPDHAQVAEKKERITSIGSEIYADGGVDAMENFFFALDNRIQGELEMDAGVFRSLWNGLDPAWDY